MDWIMSNWLTVWTIVTTLVALAVAVAKITPTKKDDEIVGWIAAAIEKVSQWVTRRPESKSDV